MNIFFLQFLLGILFLSIFYLHLAKKNFGAVIAYSIQSLIITLILFTSFLETNSFFLLFVVLVTLVIKVILASVFFFRLIQKHKLTFSVSTYLNLPLTLIVLAGFTAIAHSQKFLSLTNIIPAHQALLSLALSAIFISLFLVINRKDALSQAVGILSLENSIVAFAIFAGLEQSPMLQFGIIFDIFIWLVISTVFISMIYRHFGSLDTSTMKHLKD
ncbi:MAG: hypothetical protein COY69_01695 [Candidatus Magasanikbacteria bacterium CG_4_10_14_0_8_um_filter_32_14]|uniref:Hydrogenase n=2 Tax=Candidatus Magasanikiibacteriota TaxID=1752731 RepID=A0A2M7R9G6_9BACT|nr:MAG: hypothetical protein AUJ23_01855 [Candidatus Magasanikbacteria bacterium CG1_02_32_51]PIY93408.1 MAG: hypothetical protein COY69_01695 [Candidatus Magasanikbacteria bacterium CG_4_10_14_0_8_um_filter_32_14]